MCVASVRPVTIITGTSTDLLAQVSESFAHLLLIGVPGILALAAVTVWLVVKTAGHLPATATSLS